MMPEMDGYQVAERIRQDPALADTTVVMLTSADRQGDAARCRAIGVAFLVKPVKPAELNRAIATAFASPSASGRGLPRLTRPQAENSAEPDVRPLRVLVAEDNPVNQKVIVGLLAKGNHVVTVAGDGRQAVAAFDAQSFDVVLMDVQMPEMDGFEATAAIRQRDTASGRHTPIVAMTAHAMKGDRERCLAAGMDEYVSKPVQRSELHRVLAWAAGVATPPAPTPTVSPADSTPPPRGQLPPLDRATAVERLGGDEELFAEVADVFRGDAPKLLDVLNRAVATGDAATVRRAAHGLKGAAGYVGGGPTAAAAEAMERIGASGDLSAAGGALELLTGEVARLSAALS
jgi:two-component system sensor histidine kinase/response regulator